MCEKKEEKVSKLLEKPLLLTLIINFRAENQWFKLLFLNKTSYLNYLSIKPILTLLFLYLIQLLGYGQTPGWWNLTDEDGLPGMTVHEIVQDERGYIWMGTSNGLCKFDGRNFHVYADLDLQDNEILKVNKDDQGRIWFLTLANELAYMEGDSMHKVDYRFFDLSRTLNTFWLIGNRVLVSSFEIDKLDLFYFAFNEEKVLQKISSMELTAAPSHLNSKIVEVNGKAFFVCLRYVNDKFQIYLIELGDQKMTLQKKIIEKGQTFIEWEALAGFPTILITNDTRLGVIEDGTFSFFPNIDVQYNILYHVENELAYVKSKKDGLLLVDLSDKPQVLQTQLGHIDANSMMKDREGNFWIGTTGTGLLVAPSFDIKYFNTYTNGLPSNYIYTIYPHDSSIYIGQSDGWLTEFKENVPQRSVHMPKYGVIRALTINEQQQFVVGMDLNLMSSEDPFDLSLGIQRVKLYSTKKIIDGRKTDFVLASGQGVWELDFENVVNQSITPSHRLINKRTYGICFDHLDRLWMGTTNGLYYRENGNVHHFLLSDNTEKVSITDLCFTADSTIWVATDNQGLLKIKGDTLQEQITKADGLTSNNCTALFADEKILWVGTNRGLNAMSLDKEKVMATIDVKSGLPSNEVNVIYVKEENVWVGTPNGLAIFPKSIMKQQPPPPLIELSSITINGTEMPLQAEYELSYSENDLGLHYTGLAYQSKGKEQYQYRMLGIDTTWQTTGNRDISYYALAPGTYEFQVNAVTVKNISGETPAVVRFHISPAWWQRWWVQLIAALGVLTLVSLLIYWRQRSILQQERKENKLQEKMSQLKIQALQAQMNPHFIFNTLNAIQDLLLTNDNETALDSLSHFAKMIAFIFENSGKPAIRFSEEIRFLKHYLELERLRFEDQVAIDFYVDPSLEMEAEEILLPPLLLQPLIENAFKHGLHHRLDGGKLSVRFEVNERTKMKCTIKDNGVGREQAAIFSKNRFAQKRSKSSLQITKERLNLFHQGQTKEEYLRISDLKDLKQTVTGTIVEVWL